MANKPGKWSMRPYFCEAWTELLYGTDRGKIHEQFKWEREALINHLDSCPSCPVMLQQTYPMLNMDYIRQLDQYGFARFIRILHKHSQDRLSKLKFNAPF